MASVGGITCSFVKGDAPLPKQRMAVWNLAGIDGYGAQRMGLGDSEFQFKAVAYGAASTVRAWALQIQACQGTFVTVINDWGAVYYRCLVCRVSPPEYSTAVGAGGCRGELTIEGVVT